MTSEPLLGAARPSTRTDSNVIASRTFTRPTKPLDIIENPELKHPRLSLSTSLLSPLFRSGETIEGHIDIVIDNGRLTCRCMTKPKLMMGRLLIDVVGVETCRGRHDIFRSIALELIGEGHPPPSTMVVTTQVLPDNFWELIPSESRIPFRIDLPARMGPPPYNSKYAAIRYILCATIVLKLVDRVFVVRASRDMNVVTIHNRTSAYCTKRNSGIC